jgi:hypothetical protein
MVSRTCQGAAQVRTYVESSAPAKRSPAPSARLVQRKAVEPNELRRLLAELRKRIVTSLGQHRKRAALGSFQGYPVPSRRS